MSPECEVKPVDESQALQVIRCLFPWKEMPKCLRGLEWWMLTAADYTFMQPAVQQLSDRYPGRDCFVAGAYNGEYVTQVVGVPPAQVEQLGLF